MEDVLHSHQTCAVAHRQSAAVQVEALHGNGAYGKGGHVAEHAKECDLHGLPKGEGGQPRPDQRRADAGFQQLEHHGQGEQRQCTVSGNPVEIFQNLLVVVPPDSPPPASAGFLLFFSNCSYAAASSRRPAALRHVFRCHGVPPFHSSPATGRQHSA